MKNVPANSPSASVAALSLKLFGYPELTVRGSPPTNSLPDQATASLAHLTLERQREHRRETRHPPLAGIGRGAGVPGYARPCRTPQTLPDATPLLQIMDKRYPSIRRLTSGWTWRFTRCLTRAGYTLIVAWTHALRAFAS